MRYFLIFCLPVVFACSKNTPKNEDPTCQLTSITRADYKYPIKYEDKKIVRVGNGAEHGFRLTYGNTGTLARVESPSENPYYRIDLFYNDEGKVAIEKMYEKYMENWLEDRVSFYTYTSGKLTSIRENYQRVNPSSQYDHEVIWEGENIRSIIIRSGNNIVCNLKFAYDTSQKNPMTAYNDLYYSDNLGPYYKYALFTSANRLTKAETTCPSPEVTNISYEFNDKNMLRKVFANAYELITYSYDCR